MDDSTNKSVDKEDEEVDKNVPPRMIFTFNEIDLALMRYIDVFIKPNDKKKVENDGGSTMVDDKVKQGSALTFNENGLSNDDVSDKSGSRLDITS